MRSNELRLTGCRIYWIVSGKYLIYFAFFLKRFKFSNF
jgi:hypothetical protein